MSAPSWGPPHPAPAPRPPASTSVVTGRVVSILLVLVAAAWAVGLLFMTLASVMSVGGCTSDEGACAVRGLAAVFLPWGLWLLSLVAGVLGVVLDWRRTRVWLWGPAAVVVNLVALYMVLWILFGFAWWTDF